MQSDANVPNPATQRLRMEYASHERRLTKLQGFKALAHSSPREQTDEVTVPTALRIQLAAELEGLPTTSWCQILQLRSRSTTSGTNVRTKCLHINHLLHPATRLETRTVKRQV